MLTALPNEAVARIQRNPARFARVGVNAPADADIVRALATPPGTPLSGPFWGWPRCDIQATSVGNDANSTFFLAARPPTSWKFASLVIDDPLWVYIDSTAALDAGAVKVLEQMTGWPSGVTSGPGAVAPGGALRGGGRLSLANWP